MRAIADQDAQAAEFHAAHTASAIAGGL